jgi:hypothetical protein
LVDLPIRIFRRWEWKQQNTSGRIGGPPPPWRLVSHDELQVLSTSGEWEAVPIVEGDIPENPAIIERDARMQSLTRAIQDGFDKTTMKSVQASEAAAVHYRAGSVPKDTSSK